MTDDHGLDPNDPDHLPAFLEGRKKEILEGLVWESGQPNEVAAEWLANFYWLIQGVVRKISEKRKLRSLSKNKRNFEKAGTITKSTAHMCKVFFFIKPEWEMDEKKIKASLQSWMTPLQYASFSITMDAFCEYINGNHPKVSMLMTKVLDDAIDKPTQFQDWYVAAFIRVMEKELETSHALKRDGSPKVSSSAKRTRRMVSENKNDKGSIPRRVAVAATVSPGHVTAITQDPESEHLKPRKIPFEEEDSTSSSSPSRAPSSSEGEGDSYDEDEDTKPDPELHGLYA